MSRDSRSPKERRDRKVRCPECRAELSPRGLAGHLRLKHGVTPAPKAATGVDLSAVQETLLAITGALDRMGERLEHIESNNQSRDAAHGEVVDGLRRELDEVVRSITERKASYTEDGDGEDPERQEAIRRELGRLRRRQAVLLFRMGSEAPGADPEAAEAGWGLF